MNSADAKKPKFNGAWWKKNKAEHADPKGELEGALEDYQKCVTSFFRRAEAEQSPSESELRKALEAVKKAAKDEKQNKKLGVLQKDTLTALDNYVKRADAALAELKRVTTAPLLRADIKLLVRKMSQFESYCMKHHQSESFNFLSLMYKNPKSNRQWYDDFIADSGKFQINIAAPTKRDFDNIAKAVASEAQADTEATWDAAPWDKAIDEIEHVLEADVLPRFRYLMTGEMMKGSLPDD